MVVEFINLLSVVIFMDFGDVFIILFWKLEISSDIIDDFVELWILIDDVNFKLNKILDSCLFCGL